MRWAMLGKGENHHYGYNASYDGGEMKRFMVEVQLDDMPRYDLRGPQANPSPSFISEWILRAPSAHRCSSWTGARRPIHSTELVHLYLSLDYIHPSSSAACLLTCPLDEGNERSAPTFTCTLGSPD